MFDFPKNEEKILKFWKEKEIFKKSLEKTKNRPRFVFFEGPPFANGLPGIHHLLARSLKDAVLRYKAMQGFYVERRAGWDTHGLPTEMEAEKKLGIKTKKEIEALGIDKFIEECKRNVFTYKEKWELFTERIAYWIDMKNAYITCSNEYIETLWWILKKIYEKNLLYEDYKVVPYCPRCGTSLSAHELAQGYKRIKEPAIYVKFKVKEEKGGNSLPLYFLVWTTTPWTLPGNVAIAVGEDIDYCQVKLDKEYLILAKQRIGVLGDKKYELVKEYKGRELEGLEYEPLYPQNKGGYKVISADFVSLDEGTGLVHLAPAFGEEDMEALRRKPEFPVLLTVDEEGKMKTPGFKWNGLFVKDADPLIISDLKERNLLFKEEIYEHDYPFCWRCKTPLIYYAMKSWFIKVSAVKDKLIENSKDINWQPSYIKKGRFGEWLKEVKDWNLSRERFWGTPLPVWKCKGKNGKPCSNIKVIGSIKELEELAGKKPKDLHRPVIDEITFKCEKCGGEMKRVPQVIDCWFDSGSMPFAQWHYPFENKEKIDKNEFFPADFIAEGIDQTRGWFYTLLAVSTLLEKGTPYKNVICHGLVLDEKGQKMSKSRGNIIRPEEVIEKFGADCARLYFYTINQVAEPKRFSFKDAQNLYRKFFDTLLQSYRFFSIYKGEDFERKENFPTNNILNKWIIACVEELNAEVSQKMDNYDIVSATRLCVNFVDDLSNWYIRRAREKFKNPKNKEEKEEFLQTLYYVLLKFTKIIAPFVPFIAEHLYQSLGGEKESVHLEDWPKPREEKIDKNVQAQMQKVREITAKALALRAEKKIKVRQPLSKLVIPSVEFKNMPEMLELIKEEVNVKEIELGKEFYLDTQLTEELKEEGRRRELIRNIRMMRKVLGLTPENTISLFLSNAKEALDKRFLQEIGAKEGRLVKSEEELKETDIQKKIEFDGKIYFLGIKK